MACCVRWRRSSRRWFSISATVTPALRRSRGRATISGCPYVDYAQHLHRYALVIHHGGAGILYACLAAGLPAIVYPLDYDQFDHAARLQVAGAAWWLRDLDGLPALLRQALGASELPHGVRHLQAELHLIQSQARIVQLVEGFAQTGAVPPV